MPLALPMSSGALSALPAPQEVPPLRLYPIYREEGACCTATMEAWVGHRHRVLRELVCEGEELLVLGSEGQPHLPDVGARREPVQVGRQMPSFCLQGERLMLRRNSATFERFLSGCSASSSALLLNAISARHPQ